IWSSGRNWFRPRRRTGSNGDGSRAMRGTRRTNTPTASQPARRSVRSARTGWCRRGSTPGSPRSAPAGATVTTIPIRSCMSVFKDGVTANTHFLNVLPDGAAAPRVERIPLYEVYMRMAEELAKRSTCARLQVGTVVTHAFFRKAYRDPSGIEVLQQGGVVPVLYDKWVREWR